MYKTPKGTFDIVGKDAATYTDVLNTIRGVFEANGGEYLETPVFERKDVLLGKYGEEAESKLIYDLQDQGGELLTLRYDLTIPFVRYVKENAIRKMRRYAIGKVYRRDQPNNKQARYREFYQADFDIYGETQEPMMAETHLLMMACRILDTYGIRYRILINDIQNIHAMLEACGVPAEQYKRVCTVIDKLDKVPFASITQELLEVAPTVDLTRLQGMLETSDPINPTTHAQFGLLRAYMGAFGQAGTLQFQNSLARGLEYYTGFIWEFKCEGLKSTIVAGGRYDGLLDAPCAGISVGVSRLCAVVKGREPEWKEKYTVTTIGSISPVDKLRVVNYIQNLFPQKKVVYDFTAKDRKFTKTLQDCAVNYSRYIVIVPETEWKEGIIKIKDLKEKTEQTIIVSPV